MSPHLSVLLAHQGGWDEILLIAGPIVVIAGLLVLAKRRVDAAASADQPSERGPDDSGGQDHDDDRAQVD